MVPKVLLFVLAIGSWTRTVQKIHLFLYYKQSVFDYYLKMGCMNSCAQAQDIQQTTDLQYTRKILEVVLDTLYAIDRKFPQCKIGQGYKFRCGIDSSFKDVKELKTQLELNVMLFSIAKEQSSFKSFPYDDDLNQQMVIGIIEQNIRYFQRQDHEISQICEVLFDNLRGVERPSLKEWKKNLYSENPENTANKKLLKDGIMATLMKDKIETSIENKFKTLPAGAK